MFLSLVSIKNTFSFFFLVERQKLSKGKACDSLDNVPCSTCAQYLDGKKRRKALESEAAKCVWLPEINGCKTKAFVEKFQINCIINHHINKAFRNFFG